MRGIDQSVCQQRRIYVIHRDPDLSRIIYSRFVKRLCIDQIFHQDICDLSLQRLICFLLKVHINAEIYIPARPRLFRHSQVLDGPSHIVNVDFLSAVLPLEHIIEILLQPCLADNGLRGISFALFFQLRRGDLPGISEDRCKCLASLVNSYAFFRDIHARELCLALQESSRRFFRDISCNSHRKIFLILLQRQRIAHAHKLQDFLLLKLVRKPVLCFFLICIAFIILRVDAETVRKIGDHLLCIRAFLFLGHILDTPPPIDVRLESVEFKSIRCKPKAAVLVRRDLQIIFRRITMLFDKTYRFVDPAVQIQLPFSVCFIILLIFYCGRINYFISCEKLSVFVIDISSGPGEGDLPLDLQPKVLCIFFTLDDLQVKHPGSQYQEHNCKYRDQHETPRRLFLIHLSSPSIGCPAVHRDKTHPAHDRALCCDFPPRPR